MILVHKLNKNNLAQIILNNIFIFYNNMYLFYIVSSCALVFK